MTAKSYSELTFFRDAGVDRYLKGTDDGSAFAFPGAALSASLCQFYGANLQTTGSIVYARWVLVWNPFPDNNANGSYTGVRLIHADSGPSNITEIARFERNTTTGPRVDAYDVTSLLNGFITSGVNKQIGHQTYGGGGSGPTGIHCGIYGSWLEILWA